MMRLFVCFTAFVLFCNSLPARNDTAVVRGIADRILRDHANQYIGKTAKNVYSSVNEIPADEDVRVQNPSMDWHYSMGVLDMAMIRTGKYFREQKYIRFAIDHVDYAFANMPFFEKRKEKYPHGPFHFMWKNSELDHCGAMGAALINLLPVEPKPIYRDYIQRAAIHISEKQVRFPDGTLARTWPYPLTLWADDLYMGLSFLAYFGKYSGEKKYLDDAVRQIENFNKYLFCPETGLYYHCYYSDLQQQGGAHWGRCNGWVMLATVLLTDVLPENHPKKKEIIAFLYRQIRHIALYQNENGLWNQLLNKKDSYEETSCTAIFAYCIARAINQGWLDRRYAPVALNAWEGLKKYKITSDYTLKDVCIGTGIGNDLAFYYKRPVRDNDTHGMGLILDAGIEIIRLKQL
jgi:rhamnogalacturonyl hydrolase YesR